MTLLAPLGLIGLLGIAALIIIYIIKPNYQQKIVSSTYVWILSKKYRKRRIPTSKLRNLIIIICQILILAISAFIIARPSQILKTFSSNDEVVLVIDSSASMRTESSDYTTRFERAVEKAAAKATEIFARDGLVSVIVADNNPVFLALRFDKSREEELGYIFDDLIDDDSCFYGRANLDAAMNLCEDVVDENPYVHIILYTDTRFSTPPKDVEVVGIYEVGEEWNAAILDAYAENDDNYYNFVIEIGVYGKSEEIGVTLDVHKANSADGARDITYFCSTFCPDGEPMRIIFRHEKSNVIASNYTADNIDIIEQNELIYSYADIHVSIDADDSFTADNYFNIYGGEKEVIKVQYASDNANPFTRGAILTLKSYYSRLNRWDIQFTEVKQEEDSQTNGFDFYIYENKMPDRLPNDGVCFLANPDSAPMSLGVRIAPTPYAYGSQGNLMNVPLVEGPDFYNPLTNGINPYEITISAYMRISGYDTGVYKELISCSTGEPAVLVKDDGKSKVVIMAFSVHYSNLAVSKYYPLFFLNMFEYFFPPMVEKVAYEVGETVNLNSRGDSLDILDSGLPPFTEFPATVTFDVPGTYTVQQVTSFGNNVSQDLFINIPAAESDVWAIEDGLTTPSRGIDDVRFFKDLLLYFAIGLVSFLFLERLLHSIEGV